MTEYVHFTITASDGTTFAAQKALPAAPPPVGQLLVGGTLRSSNPSAGGDTGYATKGRKTPQDIVRVYNQADALKVFSTNWGKACAVSYSTICKPGWRNNQSTKDQVKSNMAALPDVPGNRVIMSHEFENPDGSKYGSSSGTDVTNYLADEDVFDSIMLGVNATRKNPLIHVRCCMAFSIGQPSRRMPECFATGRYDEIGMDVYSKGQINDAIGFAATYGKPGCVPEMGPLSAIPHNDVDMLAYAQQGYPAFKQNGFTWVDWFDVNGAGADLDSYDNTRNYIQGLIV